MPRTEQARDRKPSHLERELLDFYDEFTAQNARVLFIIQALAAALPNGSGLDERAATGAVFCAQWLNDRTMWSWRSSSRRSCWRFTGLHGQALRRFPRGHRVPTLLIDKDGCFAARRGLTAPPCRPGMVIQFRPSPSWVPGSTGLS